MVGLLWLKRLRDLSDEDTLSDWTENPYFQAFCGEIEFKPSSPCDPTDLVYFRERLGAEGVKRIFAVSVAPNGKGHKPYEYGTKVFVATTHKNGIIVGVVNHKTKIHDGKILEDVLDHLKSVLAKVPKTIVCDRGYRGAPLL